jgi:hypothetical protein
MSKVRKKFDLGIRLKPTDTATTLEGEIRIGDTSKFVYAYVNGAERELLSADQIQTVSNKTIDADNNTISNLETDNLKAGVLNTDTGMTGASNTQIPSALAIKTYVDDSIATKDQASEISYDPTGNIEITGVNVQAALDDADAALQTKALGTDLTNHVNAAVGAHTASAISNVPSGNLAAIDVQGALNDLQTDVDTRVVDGGSFTSGSVITPDRLDVKQSTEADLIDYAAGTGIYAGNGAATNGQLCFATDSKKMFQVIDGELQPVGGAGGTTIEIDQVAHGFAVGEGIYHNGTNWVKAQANDGATLATFVVTEVPDVDSFIAYQFGRVEVTAHGFTIGEYYFLSNTVAGQPTSTEPTNDYSNPLFYVEDANFLQIMVYRPSVIGEQTPLNDLSDVSTAGVEAEQYLKYNGATWEPSFVQEQVIQVLANEALSAGDAVYISSIGQLNKLDCTDDAKIEFIGFAREATVGAETIDVVTSGVIGGFVGLTIGEFVYADPLTPGGIVQPKPTQTDIYQIILGKAISATEILINPDLAASAEFNREITVNNNTITNNQSTPTAVTGAIFNGFRSVVANYSIYRVTDTNEVAQVGQLRLTYKTNANTWTIADDFAGDDAGVTFSVDASGQLLYTSTDLTGTNYDSKLQIDVKNLFEV